MAWAAMDTAQIRRSALASPVTEPLAPHRIWGGPAIPPSEQGRHGAGGWGLHVFALGAPILENMARSIRPPGVSEPPPFYLGMSLGAISLLTFSVHSHKRLFAILRMIRLRRGTSTPPRRWTPLQRCYIQRNR